METIRVFLDPVVVPSILSSLTVPAVFALCVAALVALAIFLIVRVPNVQKKKVALRDERKTDESGGKK